MGKKEREAELPVYEVLKAIKNGSMDPAALSKDTRELCVEALLIEGYSSSQMAGLLKRSDRTIRRIMADVREKNALSASPDLVRIIVGELVSTGRNQCARLKQIARLPEASPIDKARAEYLAWRVSKETVDKLFQVGYLSPSLLDAKSSENVEKEPPLGSDEEIELQKQYSALPPMEKERLVERLRKDILRLSGVEPGDLAEPQ